MPSISKYLMPKAICFNSLCKLKRKCEEILATKKAHKSEISFSFLPYHVESPHHVALT